MSSNIKIGISIGDIHGIGLEIILKTFNKNDLLKNFSTIVFGPHQQCFEYLTEKNIDKSLLKKIFSLDEIVENKLNILENKNYNHKVNLGIPSKESALISYESLLHATSELKAKKIDALVTAPIDKYQIRKSISDFIGHTEFLEQNFKGESLMIMTSDVMKIAFVTGHIPLNKVSQEVSTEKIIEKTKQLNYSLKQDFSIQNPKIAVLGLNPHAGENGMLGIEDSTLIEPAIQKLNKEFLLDVVGPFPADSFFTKENLSKYDGILAMYHDQGLIPFKTLSFSKGVNFTGGLNIIRTSPVHGVAYDIVNKNSANEESFKQAVITSYQIMQSRLNIKKLSSKEN
jgi:4-hydroxythreonine-4-phosphate dehydrogenase